MRRLPPVALLASLTVAVSCGGDAHSLGGADELGGTGAKAQSGAGGADSVGSGGFLGFVDAGGGPSPGGALNFESGGTQGTGGALAPSECSPNPCPSVTVSSLGISFDGCCISPIAECGVDVSYLTDFVGIAGGCQRHAQPGSVDGQCADVPLSTLGMTLSGCCRPDGVCGVNADVAGLGCVAKGAGVVTGARFCNPLGAGGNLVIDGGMPGRGGGGGGGYNGSGGAGSGGVVFADGGFVDGGFVR